MADFAKTISNSVKCFGMGPSTKWGQAVFAYSMTWGTSKWGEGNTTADTGNSVPFEMAKLIDNSVTPDGVFVGSLEYLRTISETLTPSSDMSSEELFDGSFQWNYVFGNATNAENISAPNWSLNAASATSFTSGTSSTVSWSSQ